jgi:hypothetical protein
MYLFFLIVLNSKLNIIFNFLDNNYISFSQFYISSSSSFPSFNFSTPFPINGFKPYLINNSSSKIEIFLKLHIINLINVIIKNNSNIFDSFIIQYNSILFNFILSFKEIKLFELELFSELFERILYGISLSFSLLKEKASPFVSFFLPNMFYPASIFFSEKYVPFLLGIIKGLSYSFDCLCSSPTSHNYSWLVDNIGKVIINVLSSKINYVMDSELFLNNLILRIKVLETLIDLVMNGGLFGFHLCFISYKYVVMSNFNSETVKFSLSVDEIQHQLQIYYQLILKFLKSFL